MNMTFPMKLQEMLTTIGQVAVEVESFVEGYREFVTVFRCPTSQILSFDERFPYLRGNEIVYRLMRFRVENSLIENDQHCSNEDLVGLQSLYVPSEETALHILDFWKVPPSTLVPPNQTEVPV